MNDKTYWVIDEGTDDIDVIPASSREEAINDAERRWGYLTKAERKHRRIYAVSTPAGTDRDDVLDCMDSVT